MSEPADTPHAFLRPYAGRQTPAALGPALLEAALPVLDAIAAGETLAGERRLEAKALALDIRALIAARARDGGDMA